MSSNADADQILADQVRRESYFVMIRALSFTLIRELEGTKRR